MNEDDLFHALSDEERHELWSMMQLGDEDLFIVLREEIDNKRQSRKHMLVVQVSQGNITDAEYGELNQLFDERNHLAWRKAIAAKLLVKRGWSDSMLYDESY
jgi:hypothetical protein